jgi:hypothetical protein
MIKDIAEFAVEAIRRWWRSFASLPKASALLVCVDCGGSNGARTGRGSSTSAPRRQDRIGITVCRYMPGTSKGNKIEQRKFSDISLNWLVQPLVSYETVVNLISSTKTKTGLRLKAALDEREYEAV